MVRPLHAQVLSACLALANEQIQLTHIQAALAIVLPSELEHCESVFVRSKGAGGRLVQIDEAALDHEEYQRGFRGVIGDDQRVSLACGFVDEGPGFCNPVMLQVPPVTTHRVAVNSSNMVVDPELGTRKTFQNNTEPSGRDVEATGLEPDPFRIRNPAALVVDVNIRKEVSTAPLVRIQTVGKTFEGSDRHV